MKRKIYVYRIYFPESDKCYIGQTCNLKRRMFRHLEKDSLVGNALRKYDEWKISVLHTCYTRDVSNTLEIEEIRNFNSVTPGGYNLTHGGEGGVPSEETRKKLSDSHKGKRLSKETIKKRTQVQTGVHRSKETCNKISDALRGKNHPNYGKTGENNPFYGKHHTKEALKKISDAKKDKHLSEEHKKKLGEAQRAFTDEQKKIIQLKKLKTRLRNLEKTIEQEMCGK